MMRKLPKLHCQQVRVPFKRPESLSSDVAHTPPVIEHAIKHLEEKKI